MCGNITRAAFSDLRLRRNSEHKIDFLMDQSMGWLCDQMKRTTSLICNRSMVINRELTGEIRGKDCMNRPTVQVIRSPMVMVGLGMYMDQWHNEHPQGHPCAKHNTRGQGRATLWEHGEATVAQFGDTINQADLRIIVKDWAKEYGTDEIMLSWLLIGLSKLGDIQKSLSAPRSSAQKI